ncbi:hypothetical protein [Tropicibacter oceani]|uniref:Major facilitator superfamily (MFS) profile domain-containing protein n=1 Tax=Tropicibacter oceani TaxID=3058420 RepID=A0ABY8QN73_9RHOB|nr:hypothetical protein [Tropicibacter oceani]WGW05476.1 hypothetical protein QF118_07990 [Tropicibacter oceani]
MRRLFIAIAAFLCYILLLGFVAGAAVLVTGRPGGVAYGITLHYLLLGLGIQGVIALILAEVFSRRSASIAVAALNASLTIALFPGFGSGLLAYLATSATALALCLLYLGCKPVVGRPD